MLAQDEAKTPEEALDYYRKGVDAGERALGPELFAEYEGRFWRWLETRPYMRARHGVAVTLLEMGDVAGAIGHYREMLRLNPGDNQGIRDELLDTLLATEDFAGVDALMEQYERDGSARWAYTAALRAFQRGNVGDDETMSLIQDALRSNSHVPALLARTRPPAPLRSDFITVGGLDEAQEYVARNAAAWKRTPGAINWLIQGVARVPPPRRRS